MPSRARRQARSRPASRKASATGAFAHRRFAAARARARRRSSALSAATVAAAYRRLRARGLAAGAGRRGTRVSRAPSAAAERRPPPRSAHLRDLADGNPDPALLPSLARCSRGCRAPLRLYGAPSRAARAGPRRRRRDLARDGIPAAHLAVMGGALDGIERVLQAHLRPGDRVAVEDPGYTGVLDLVGALGLVPAAGRPRRLRAPSPGELARALRAGARAVVLTPRAQNPTGAALDADAGARAARRCSTASRACSSSRTTTPGPSPGVGRRTVCAASRALGGRALGVQVARARPARRRSSPATAARSRASRAPGGRAPAG